MEGNFDQDSLWETRITQNFMEDLNDLKEKARRKVMEKVQQLASGNGWMKKGADTISTDLWKLNIEDSKLGTGHLLWWVELHITGQDAQQVIMLHRVYKATEWVEVQHAAEGYLRTFSDAYLQDCITRMINGQGQVEPRIWTLPANFKIHRDVNLHMEMADGRPVSLEKRYRVQQKHMALLINHGLKNIQLPYVLDHDEERVLEQVCRAPVFLLGRSGSGKTTVLCHALFYLHAKPDEWFRDSKVGPVLLITRSEKLSSAIQKLFLQMCDAEGRPQEEQEEVHGPSMRGNLEALDEESQTFHKMPKSFKKEDMGDEKTLICHWKEFLLAADASLPPPFFFRHAVESVTDRARRQFQQEREGRTMNAADRFPQLAALDGKWDIKKELSYEFFVKALTPKLRKILSERDSLYVVFKEILTVITGSLRAVRSRTGFLSREEYVTGSDAEGTRLPESNDSAVKDEGYRERIYTAFEEYQKLKERSTKYDRIDPIRHITQRASALGRGKRFQRCQRLAAMFIDEVQDLLPAEILLLRLFCPTNRGWVFAGDTAQTISKGVDFRFESIRRLYYEEFVKGKDWEQDTIEEKFISCSMCQKDVQKGTTLECNSNWLAHTVNLCEDEKCLKSFQKKCEDAAKGLSSGARKKKEWADARNKYSCPMSGCGMYMKESPFKFAAAPTRSEDSEEDAFLPDYTQVPPIQHLTHNHRSTRGILQLAGSVIDQLVSLFPHRVDALPREVSRVDTHQRPVFVSGLRLDSLNDLIFRDDSTGRAGRVLEFGAQQGVLAWSPETQESLKQRFEMSMVLTIDECKGLEFEDVLVINPCSDMAEHGPESLRHMWKFVLESSRVSFDDSVHAEFCTWLKHLYVAVTRARRRLWIVEEKREFAEPLMTLWREQVQLVTTRAEADEVQQGFARTSSPEEFLEEGIRMLEQRQFLNASICFRRAASAGLQIAKKWRELTQILHLEQEIELLEDTDPAKRKKHQECAKSYLGLSNSLEASNEILGDMTHRKAKVQAADQYVQGELFLKAAALYLEVGRFPAAAECFELEEKWLEAGQARQRAHQLINALWDFSNGNHWAEFISCAEEIDNLEAENHQVLPKLMKEALRKVSAESTGAVFDADKADHARRLLRLLGRSLRQHEVDAFVSNLKNRSLHLEYLQEQGRFEECSALALEAQGWERAYEFDLRLQQTSRSLVLGLLQSLGLSESPTAVGLQQNRWDLQQNRCYQMLRQGASENLNALDQNIWRLLCDLEEGFASSDALERFWTSCRAVDDGVGIRLQCLALQKACHLRDRRGASRSHNQWLGDCMKEMDLRIGSFLQALERSSDLPPEQEECIFKLILAEQPDCVRPRYLVLGRDRVGYEEVPGIAREELVLLRTALHTQMLKHCQWVLHTYRPCKSQLWNGCCPRETACAHLHSWGPAEGQGFVEHLMLTFDAWQDAHKVIHTSLFRSILAKHQKEDTTWIDKLETVLLRACLPYPGQLTSLLPDRAEVIELRNTLLRRALDRLASEVYADHKKGSRHMQLALVSAPGALVWSHLVDFHQVPFFRWVVDRFRHGDYLPPRMRLPSNILTLLECQRESLLAGTARVSYKDLVNRFSFSIKVMQELRKLWKQSQDGADFPCSPRTLTHLLEETACWAIVLLTQFSNTTLPKSWVKNHLCGNEYLAALAAHNQLPRWRPNSRGWVINMLAEIIDVTAVFVHDQNLQKWAERHHEIPAEVALRLYTIIFGCGTINWLKHIRNEKIISAVRKNAEHRLKLMNNFRGWGENSLPQMMQWLVMGPPKGITVDGREFDRMTPWFHSVMCGLNDELVILHRRDSGDLPPGWTDGRHTLDFGRFDFIGETNVSPLLKQYVNMWPRECISIKYPALPTIYVFDPSQDACDFSGVGRSWQGAAASGHQSSNAMANTFVLDKTASAKDAEKVEADQEAANKLAIAEKQLPPRVSDRTLQWLASARARLQRKVATKFEKLCSASQLLLTRKSASNLQKAAYFVWVVPSLDLIHEDSGLKKLQSAVLTEKDRRGPRRLGGAGLNEDGPENDLLEVLDVLDEMEHHSTTFRRQYEQRVLDEEQLGELDRDAKAFRAQRKELRHRLKDLVQKLERPIQVDWAPLMLPLTVQEKLREAKARLKARCHLTTTSIE